jgi:hypothetical protein
MITPHKCFLITYLLIVPFVEYIVNLQEIKQENLIKKTTKTYIRSSINKHSENGRFSKQLYQMFVLLYEDQDNIYNGRLDKTAK